MLVVSNTSPILNLAIIGQTDLLRRQFAEVRIPPAVLRELMPDADRPGSEAVRRAIEAGWLRVEAVTDTGLVIALQRDLDDGEAEAIALAKQLGADLLLLDERDGRREARRLGIRVAGVLGILESARRSGDISALHPCIDDLREHAGFHLAPALVAQVLAEEDGLPEG